MQVDGGKKKQRSRPGLQRLWLEQECGDSEKELGLHRASCFEAVVLRTPAAT